MPIEIGKYHEKEDKDLSRISFLDRCRFHLEDAGNPSKFPRVAATDPKRATTTYTVDENEDEMNRGQPKSLSFPTNSARSKLAKGSSRVRRPELIRFFPEGFDHSSPDLENYCLLESGTERTQGLA